jgi:CheY-like chemotaxis protein
MFVDVEDFAAAAGHVRLRPVTTARPRRRVWSLNILVVDDDPADTALVLAALNANPDVSSARATDSPEFALRQFSVGHHLKPDLVLLDIHMPKLDGFAFLRAMRRIPAMKDVPVVFLTTSGLSSDVAKTQDSSAVLYVLKPDSYADLQARLNGVVRLMSCGDLSH